MRKRRSRNGFKGLPSEHAAAARASGSLAIKAANKAEDNAADGDCVSAFATLRAAYEALGSLKTHQKNAPGEKDLADMASNAVRDVGIADDMFSSACLRKNR